MTNWEPFLTHENQGRKNVPAMFQQKTEKTPKLFEFQRLTLKYPYPEPGSNRHGCYPIGV